MNCRTYPQRMVFLRVLSVFKTLRMSFLILCSMLIVSCNTHTFDQTARYAEAKFFLDSANFETEVTYATGEASCLYILFSIPVCQHQNITTKAWDKMRQKAHMEGKSAQFVNIVEDHSLRWNFLYLIYQEHYSVSGNVIVYKQPYL